MSAFACPRCDAERDTDGEVLDGCRDTLCPKMEAHDVAVLSRDCPCGETTVERCAAEPQFCGRAPEPVAFERPDLAEMLRAIFGMPEGVRS